MNLRDKMLQLEQRMNAQVLGQENVVRMLLIALLCDGHILLEGLPGLAKTRAVRELARHIAGEFRRIQFTPDLLPSDITGSEIYQQNASREEEQFRFRPGPVFGNVILADEINRASARVQSALLEAMEERHVTVAGKSWPLPGVFMVLATQNPVDQEGTWPLPEAQLDRFLMKVQVDYPSKEHEQQVMQLVRAEQQTKYGVAAKTPPRARSGITAVQPTRDRLLLAGDKRHPRRADYRNLDSRTGQRQPPAAAHQRTISQLSGLRPEPARHLSAGALRPRAGLARGT